MAYIRKLDSGNWQGVVKLRSGRQVSMTHPLKAAVQDWVREQETNRARGLSVDPRGARVPFGEQAERWLNSRVVEPRTLRDYWGTYRNHVKEHWADVPLGNLTRLEVETWLRDRLRDGMSARNGQKVLVLMGAVLKSAVAERLIAVNPVEDIKPPRSAKQPPTFLSREEAATLVEAFSGSDRLLVNLMLHTGLRWGEAAGLRWSDLDIKRGQVSVVGVVTQEGQWREYPKSTRSNRTVPVPKALLTELRNAKSAESAETYIFTGPGGGHLLYVNWLRRNWHPVVDKLELTVTPHKLRHTYASWLVESGVSLYRVQGLLGHESHETTMIYAHLVPDAFDDVLAALG